ncbi:phage major capsid protein [Pseudarthrobacter sp. YS3]|uniref:phage major capsid protein n=1 Tax=Pseudarthrobacter sp. YS3 TaxID=3453718 RepID=UPI003EEC756D
MATYAELMTEAKSLVDAGKAGTLTHSQVSRMDTIKADIEAAKQQDSIAQGDALIAQLKAAGNPTPAGGQSSTVLNLTQDEMQGMYEAAQRKQSFRVQAKSGPIAYKVASAALTQPQMNGQLVSRPHEPARLLAYIPQKSIDAGSVDFLTHSSSAGGAATVARGGLKPELLLDWTPTTLTARKIAVQSGVPDEVLADFGTFLAYLTSELSRSVIDVENAQILNGDGVGENLLGLLNTSGILTRAKATDTALDAVEQSIADLRTGPSYVDPDVLVFHPTTWSTIRRSKDAQGRYLLGADPTAAEANSLWGLPVLATTTMPVGTGLIGNMAEGVQAFIRQGITTDIGVSADDFVKNITRIRCEERIALGVTRPSALLKITGL